MGKTKSVFAVFSGGGVKGAAFVGAIKVAEKHVNYLGVGGTSAGAIVASLLACGYRAEELEQILFNAPYAEFFKFSWARFILDKRRGLCDPYPLLKWLRQHIEAKVKVRDRVRVTFKDLNQHPGALALKIVATNLTAQDIKIYSVDESPNEEVAQAVLASCSFPIVFPAVKSGVEELADGGVMSNFPMWLFDDERKKNREAAPVLGFSLTTQSSGQTQRSSLASFSDIFDSILIAQDRVQEKYLDGGRLADVIRIKIPHTATFDRKQTEAGRQALLTSGQAAALEYFANAPNAYEQRVRPPATSCLRAASDRLEKKDFRGALSLIAREHVLRGGVAKDDGLGDARTFVRYYIDLMEAATQREKVEILAQVLASKLPRTFDRIIGIKKGNVLLASQVAYVAKKPLALVKGDFSYKMGYPFDGAVNAREQVVLVDDIASDASMLLHAIRQLSMHHVQVVNVVTLIERPEGDARVKLAEANCLLISVSKVGDAEIEGLIERDTHFPGESS